MPKIQNIARFTTPVDISKLQGNVKKQLPPALQKALAAKAENSKALIRTIMNVLIDSDQPLSVAEVTESVYQTTGRHYHETHIRQILDNLAVKNSIISRKETHAERELRAGGRARATVATLFWAPYGEIPARTVREAVPGVLLNDFRRRHEDDAEVELIDVTPADSSLEGMNLNNDVIERLVEMIVRQRTIVLEAELQAKTLELDQLRAKVKSLLG